MLKYIIYLLFVSHFLSRAYCQMDLLQPLPLAGTSRKFYRISGEKWNNFLSGEMDGSSQSVKRSRSLPFVSIKGLEAKAQDLVFSATQSEWSEQSPNAMHLEIVNATTGSENFVIVSDGEKCLEKNATSSHPRKGITLILVDKVGTVDESKLNGMIKTKTQVQHRTFKSCSCYSRTEEIQEIVAWCDGLGILRRPRGTINEGDWPQLDRMRPNWPQVNWPQVNWPQVNWPQADWPQADWPQADWPQANWPQANWPQANWPQANWPQANWPQADWPQINGPQVGWPQSSQLSPGPMIQWAPFHFLSWPNYKGSFKRTSRSSLSLRGSQKDSKPFSEDIVQHQTPTTDEEAPKDILGSNTDSKTISRVVA